MIMRFKTKRNTNGVVYYLTIDTEKKTFSKDYDLYRKDTDITITKTDRRNLVEQLEENGYKEV